MMNLKLASVMAVIGLIFTSRPWLNWLGTLSPEAGLFLKYTLILFIILSLHVMDPTVDKPRRQALGVFAIYVAFMLIFNYQSDWIEESGSSGVEVQSPDGVVYHRARTTFGMKPETARIVSFVILPSLLVLVGSKLVKNGQKLKLE